MICASLYRPFFIVNLVRYLAEKILPLNTTNFRGDYHVTCGKKNRAYDQFVKRRMLLDFKSEDGTVGIKYSCFDGDFGRWNDPQKHTRDPDGSPEAVGV